MADADRAPGGGAPGERRSAPALTAVVLTLDEEANLPACLDSLAGWVDDLVVVDSGSTDGTLEIARRYDARILHHPFETHGRQWRWALDRLSPDVDWVLALDADQRVTPELREEILATLRTTASRSIDGYYLPRRQIFLGRWIRRGGYYPVYLLKLFRRSAARIDENDLVDHHFYVAGPTAKLRHDLVEENRKEHDLAFWMAKHRRYAELQAREEVLRRARPDAWPIAARLFGSPDQRTIWLKRRWHGMPLFLRPFLYFGYRYVLRLGFLDGRRGLVFHFLQGFWYRMLVDIQLHRMRRAGAGEGPLPAAGADGAGKADLREDPPADDFFGTPSVVDRR